MARAYLQDSVIDRVAADLKTGDAFVLISKELIEKHGPAEIIKDC